jgi:hypothetical protein
LGGFIAIDLGVTNVAAIAREKRRYGCHDSGPVRGSKAKNEIGNGQ